MHTVDLTCRGLKSHMNNAMNQHMLCVATRQLEQQQVIVSLHQRVNDTENQMAGIKPKRWWELILSCGRLDIRIGIRYRKPQINP